MSATAYTQRVCQPTTIGAGMRPWSGMVRVFGIVLDSRPAAGTVTG